MKTYRFTHPFRYSLITLSLGLLLILLLPILYKALPPDLLGFVWFAVIILTICAFHVIGTLTNKITVSTCGFEYVSYGFRISKPWDRVEKIRLYDVGIVSIVFNESIIRSPILQRLLHPLVSDYEIQLSPFLDDLFSSELVRDIMMFAPHCEVPEQEHRLISNQKSA